MKYFAPIAVIAIILLQLSGAVPDSSVGGPMTIAFALLLGALVYGLYEAWTMKRGVVGWIVNLIAAPVGGIVAAMLGGTLMDFVMPVIAPLIDLQGSLAATRHPFLYILSAAMMLLTLFGAWVAISLVNRMR